MIILDSMVTNPHWNKLVNGDWKENWIFKLLTKDLFCCVSDFREEDNAIFKFSFICLPPQLPMELKVFLRVAIMIIRHLSLMMNKVNTEKNDWFGPLSPTQFNSKKYRVNKDLRHLYFTNMELKLNCYRSVKGWEWILRIWSDCSVKNNWENKGKENTLDLESKDLGLILV